jgi:pyruvate dehydrogenase (quinone)
VGQIASEALVERLADWGVDTGRLGVCLATSILGPGYQQEVTLDRLYEDVAEYNQMIYNPAQIPAVADMAVRTAHARRGVAHITVPNDIQVADAGDDPWQHVAPARSPRTAPVLLSAPGRPREQEIDTLFMAGTNFPYTKYLPEAGKVRVAQIEADPARAGARVATELPVVGDAKEALTGLLPLLKQRSDTSFLEKCQKGMGRWRQKMADMQDAERDPIAPQYVVSVLDQLAADDAILTCDSGTIATWAARHWMIRGGRENGGSLC